MNGFKLFVSGGATALITDDTSNHVPRIKYTNIAGINCADGAMITVQLRHPCRNHHRRRAHDVRSQCWRDAGDFRLGT